MNDTTESPNPNPNLLDALKSLDVSQFSAFSRARPSTANIAPNNTQKEYLKRHAAEAHILLRISGLWISNQVRHFIFSRDARYTLETYISASHRLTDSIATHTMEDMYQIRKLHERIGFQPNIDAFDPKLFGIPIQVDDIPNGMLRAITIADEPITIDPQSIDDADSIFKTGKIPECFLFAFFYLLDQKCLLEGDRNRGQTIPRFLRIYASHTMNQILFTYFDAFMVAYREVLMEGVEEDKITLGLLATVMTRGAE